MNCGDAARSYSLREQGRAAQQDTDSNVRFSGELSQRKEVGGSRPRHGHLFLKIVVTKNLAEDYRKDGEY